MCATGYHGPALLCHVATNLVDIRRSKKYTNQRFKVWFCSKRDEKNKTQLNILVICDKKSLTFSLMQYFYIAVFVKS